MADARFAIVVGDFYEDLAKRLVEGAQRVFADQQARERLEAIIHPRVRARTAALVAQAPPGSVVVNDVPLLVESGMEGML